MTGHVEVLDVLADHGADIDTQCTDDGTTPLFKACQNQHLAVRVVGETLRSNLFTPEYIYIYIYIYIIFFGGRDFFILYIYICIYMYIIYIYIYIFGPTSKPPSTLSLFFINIYIYILYLFM